MKHFFYPILLILFLLGLTQPLKAQVIEQFSDGNLNNNPSWIGDDSLFTINTSQQLQSAAKPGTSGEIALSTWFEPNMDLEWRIWVRLAFNPSSQNSAKIYLCTNQTNLKGALNGFYIQLGGSTGNTDSISLYKQIGQARTCVIKGRPATLGKVNNQLQLKVTRSKLGEWQLLSDTSAKSNFILEGTTNDTAFSNASYFGISCKYTSSNVANFMFDEIYIGAPIIDKKPPQLLSVSLIQPNQINLTFDEKIEPNLKYNISIQDSIKPINSQFINNELRLIFNEAVPQDKFINIGIKGIQDLNENVSDTTFNHLFHWLTKGDLLITELMADPEPSQGLPLVEFIELYNNTLFDLNIDQLSLKDASSTVTLPNFKLQAGQFLILCNQNDSILLKDYGSLLPLLFFPTLNNSGDSIKIVDKNGIAIDAVNYNLSYYKNSLKETGGWSLELINPNQTCKGKDNWMASTNNSGGSPGQVNSNWQTSLDTLAPQLLNLEIISAFEFRLLFNEAIEEAKNIELNGIKIKNINIVSGQKKEVQLLLEDSLVHQKNYVLQIDSIIDCSGNSRPQTKQFTFTAIGKIKQHDLLMNEVYFIHQ